MKERKRLPKGFLLLFGVLASTVSAGLYAQEGDTFLIDDFSGQDRRSEIGTRWQQTTDI
jgi:hypothetical protein